ncbi:MAG TPA: hypothetical protein PLW86_20245, partial [Rhodocyclaceae bacterium]|nr:hypothetical protein [Rhodocyclaceae bacterium]
IMRARESELPWSLLVERLAMMEDACRRLDCEEALALLALLVNEYAPLGNGEDELVWRAMAAPIKADAVVH